MIAKRYYENVMVLEKLRVLSEPAEADIKKVLGIIKDDVELTLYFYDVLDPGWVELLDKAGEFEGLREKETGMIGKYKAHYLKKCAETKADDVLGIIEKIDAQDINIQGTLIRTIVNMPEETAIKGIGVVTKYLDKQENKWWYAIGESAAKLMVKLVVNHPDKAFEVADALLDAWVSEEKTYGKDIVAKFSEDEYSKLMLEYYKKVWEANPERAVRVLIKILNRCLETLDEKEDVSRSFSYGLELGDLDKIDMNHPRIRTVLVKGICEAGRVLIDKESGKVSNLLDLLEGTNRVIFLRIAMYLLRFVKPDTEKDRISKLVGNKEYFKEYNPCWNEHRRLLNDKFDEVGEQARKVFVEWVAKQKITEKRKKEVEEWCRKNNDELPDFEKWENQAKAKELYLVQERFRELYEEYHKKSGVNDADLAPRRMVSEARDVSPMEGTPLAAEEMAKKKVDDVLDYILEPKNYEGRKKADEWHDPVDALRSTFKEDVKKRPKKYLGCDITKLKAIPASFLTSLFYGLNDSIRDGSFEKYGWEHLIEVATEVVNEKHQDETYRSCFSAIVGILRDAFSERDNAIELDKSMAKQFWSILASLVHFPMGDMSRFGEEGHERDPMQIRCNIVAGEALGITVSLGIACKKRFEDYWTKELKGEMRECWEFALIEIKEPGVNCVFGVNFSRIYWMDNEWVEKNLENLFSDKNWDEIWGTYTSWGRPSPDGFKLLVDKGKYKLAVDMLGTENKFKFGKEPDKGLTEHLMIGYFNGWIDYEHEVLQKFFDKAPAGLRAKAARFLATGFKDLNEKGGNEKKEVAARMKQYWESRLTMMDKEEAIGFMKWVGDSVLDGKETLEFVEKTLNISGGELSKHGDTKGFVEGVCEFGKEKGNELLALRCFKKAAAYENMHMTWSRIQEPLVNFLGAMVDISEDVRSAAIEVADAYGRYNPDKFRGVWAKLNEKN